MPAKLYVGNIANSCSQDELHSLFDKYGRVTELDIVKNFAFVHFEREDEAQKAVRELHDTNFLGSKLQVQFSKNQEINRGNKHVLKSYDKRPSQWESRDSRSDLRSDRDHRSHRERDRHHDIRSQRIKSERISNSVHREHRSTLSSTAHHRSKPYDRVPPIQAPALNRIPHALAAALNPRQVPVASRVAAYADYYKASALAPPPAAEQLAAARAASIPASQLAAARAAALASNAYYDRLLEYKDRRLDAPPVAPAPPIVTPSAYAAFYREAIAKDPYIAAQAALERFASASHRPAANPYALAAPALPRGYPPYR